MDYKDFMWRKFLRHISWKEAPVILGDFSVEFGLTLKKTEEILNDLETKGLIRPLTLEEKSAQGLSTQSPYFILTCARDGARDEEDSLR